MPKDLRVRDAQRCTVVEVLELFGLSVEIGVLEPRLLEEHRERQRRHHQWKAPYARSDGSRR